MNEKYIMSRNELTTLQALPTEIKMQKSLHRIREWIDYYGEANVYASFSGGLASTVLYYLIKLVNPNVPAIFVNDRNQIPSVTRHVYQLKGQNNSKYAYITKRHEPYNYDWNQGDTIVVRVTKHKIQEVIKENGYLVVSKSVSRQIYDCRKLMDANPDGYADDPRFLSKLDVSNRYSVPKAYQYLIYDRDIKISHMCCIRMKESEFLAYERETGRYAPFTGEQAEESRDRREAYMKFGCNGFNRKKPKSTPLGFWTKQDLLWVIKKYNLPYAQAYGDIITNRHGKLITTGEQRTGCMCCTAGVMCEKCGNNRFQNLAKNYPKQFEFAMKPLEQGGLGMRAVLDKLGVSTDYVEELNLEELYNMYSCSMKAATDD